MRRDEVVDLLWRGVEEARARNAFRQALHRLRNAVGEDVLPQDRERLRLVRSDLLAIDLHQFDQALAARQYAAAIEACAGDFLQDAVVGEPAFDLWVEQERVRIRSRLRAAAEGAMAVSSAAGDWAGAIGHARRLMQVAPYEPEAALAAATTLVSAGQAREARELLSRFSARLEAELGVSLPPELKSLMTRLERARDTPRDQPTQPGARTPSLSFAGRESELAQLLTLWRTTQEDSGTLVLIEGQEGIGKSRLVHEFIGHAKALRPGTFLVAHERVNPVPLGLFADALRPLVRAPGVSGASPHLLAEAARLLPELRDALELPPVSDVEDEAARLRFFEGIAALIDAAAYERPLLIALEDLQHVAPSSLDLLTYLVARLAASPVMFVLTMRGGNPVSSRLRAVAEPMMTPGRGERALALALAPLSTSAAEKAVAESLPSGAQRPTISAVVRAAGGVPGQLVELLRRLAAGEQPGAPLVSGARVMQDRLQRLSSAHRRFFLVIALIRRAADLDTLASAAHLPGSAARDALRLLESEGLVDVDVDGRITPMPAAADVAVAESDPDVRAFLSRWIAAALANRPGTEPSELARFSAAAGDADEAFQQYQRAALASLSLGASTEAIAFLGLARTFASTPERQAGIEGLLTALGSGKRRLTTPETARTRSDDVVVDARMVSPWERFFPNWRALLGAAVATLLISTFVLWRSPDPFASARNLTDTLVVAEGEPAQALRLVTFGANLAPSISPGGLPKTPLAWLDSLPHRWTDALLNPGATHVAVSHRGPAGNELHVISANRADTTAILVGDGEARALGWSPDGRWLLASRTRRLPGSVADADLIAVNIADPSRHVVIDDDPQRSVVEARWAPDGLHVAWVARLGNDRQLEVFVSRADGSGPRNVSNHPADDYHVSWSGDGELLAFTSTRDGNAELYAFGLTEGKTWRLTRDPAQDDWAQYSGNGRLVAFESTRGGTAAVYVMPGLGGEARRLESRSPMAIREWRSGPARYVSAVRVEVSGGLHAGDSAILRPIAIDQFGDSLPLRGVALSLLDSGRTRLLARDSSSRWVLVAARGGVTDIVASAGGWRVDTTTLRLGSEPVVLLQGQGAGLLPAWMPLGEPPPAAGVNGVALNADRDNESGLLSRMAVPLAPGLTVMTTLVELGPDSADRTGDFGIALVAPEPAATLDRAAPQFLKYASVSWNAEARRLNFAVGREVFSEVRATPFQREISAMLRVERDSTVSFEIDGALRWRSSLRVITQRSGSRVQAWIGARSTGPSLVVRDARVILGPLPASSR